MDRIKFASELIRSLPEVSSLLDVGSRDCALKEYLPAAIGYKSADLEQNKDGTVTYVGDINSIEIDEQFDCIVALDILEHVESPGALFDRLLNLTRHHLLISLPNCYDLKGRLKFSLHGSLGGKYRFLAVTPVDRHRWVMGRDEILAFYWEKAKSRQLSMRSADLLYGDPASSKLTSRFRALSRAVLPKSLCTSTVFGLFRKTQ